MRLTNFVVVVILGFILLSSHVVESSHGKFKVKKKNKMGKHKKSKSHKPDSSYSVPSYGASTPPFGGSPTSPPIGGTIAAPPPVGSPITPPPIGVNPVTTPPLSNSPVTPPFGGNPSTSPVAGSIATPPLVVSPITPSPTGGSPMTSPPSIDNSPTIPPLVGGNPLITTPPVGSPSTPVDANPTSPVVANPITPPTPSPIGESSTVPPMVGSSPTTPPVGGSPTTAPSPTSGNLQNAPPPTSGNLQNAPPPTSGNLLNAPPPTSGNLPNAPPPTSGNLSNAAPPTSGNLLNAPPQTSGNLLNAPPPTSGNLPNAPPPTSGNLPNAPPPVSNSPTTSPVVSSPTTPSGLQLGFYRGLCPSQATDVEALIETKVTKQFKKDPTILPALLRMQFHDCFVNGCDASILVAGSTTERNAGPNLTVRGYEFIDALKAALEAQCPGVVSCADITAIATKVLIKLGGGPDYAVQTGRRDGRRSDANDVDLPSPSVTVPQSISAFAAKGFTAEEMVTLLGCHTVGVSHCGFFENRLSNGASEFDPLMDPNLRKQLILTCPQGRSSNNMANLDQNPLSSNKVDNSYFDQLQKNRGILPIDQALTRDPQTSGFVSQLAQNAALFNKKLGDAMVKLQALDVLTGSQGEIRKVCSKFN